MQERRTLYYLDLDDIPKSAVAYSSYDADILPYNVFYIPIRPIAVNSLIRGLGGPLMGFVGSNTPGDYYLILSINNREIRVSDLYLDVYFPCMSFVIDFPEIFNRYGGRIYVNPVFKIKFYSYYGSIIRTYSMGLDATSTEYGEDYGFPEIITDNAVYVKVKFKCLSNDHSNNYFSINGCLTSGYYANQAFNYLFECYPPIYVDTEE